MGRADHPALSVGQQHGQAVGHLHGQGDAGPGGDLGVGFRLGDRGIRRREHIGAGRCSLGMGLRFP